MRLSDAGPSPAVAQQPASAALLYPDESSKLLARLPAAETDQSEQQEFRFSEQSPPPPRTGQQILVAFPPPGRPAAEQPPAQPTAADSAPLEVLRYAPDGEVAIAPHLSVTFSQPMVAVSSQSEAAQNVPVQLSPEPPGHWRWIGTRTLIFEPEARFPMATRFRVEVPAGTRSAVGGTLGTAKSWEFSTPAPQLEAKYPDKGPKRIVFAGEGRRAAVGCKPGNGAARDGRPYKASRSFRERILLKLNPTLNLHTCNFL